MAYLELPASSPTARFVQTFWQSTETIVAPVKRRVLPDGCADFVFDFSPQTSEADCAGLVGTMTRPLLLDAAGKRDFFGIRFRPGVPFLLWRLPMKSLTDTREALYDVVAGARPLTGQLARARTLRERAAIAERWIETRLRETCVTTRELETLSALNAHMAAGKRPGDFAERSGWNERKLQRYFDSAFGTSPATMHCFWRFERTRRVLSEARHCRLNDLALAQGYSDQAHMAREFRRFSGLTITAWCAEADLAP